ncbi:MAG: hypothetical protein WC462_03930 [archaeon]
MEKGFSLTSEQKNAFDDILSNKNSVSANIAKQTAKFDAFKALLGSERILTDLKSKLLLSFRGQALVDCDPANSKEVLIALTKFVIQTDMKPVLVLMNYNYKTVLSALEEAGVKENVIMIDTISKSIAQVDDEKNLFFVDSLRNLTQLQIKMLNVIEKNNGCAFVFDSLVMLELYHEPDVVFKFVYSLTKLLHKNRVNGFFISSKKSFSLKLSQFFEEVIELKKFI